MFSIIFWGLGEIFHGCVWFFQAGTDKKLRGKIKKIHGTPQYDAKLSAKVGKLKNIS